MSVYQTEAHRQFALAEAHQDVERARNAWGRGGPNTPPMRGWERNLWLAIERADEINQASRSQDQWQGFGPAMRPRPV